jgi:hypothetical protein
VLYNKCICIHLVFHKNAYQKLFVELRPSISLGHSYEPNAGSLITTS